MPLSVINRKIAAVSLLLSCFSDRRVHAQSAGQPYQGPSIADLNLFLREGKVDTAKLIDDVAAQFLESVDTADFSEIWRLFLAGEDTVLRLKWWTAYNSAGRYFILCLYVLQKNGESPEIWRQRAMRLNKAEQDLRLREIEEISGRAAELRALISKLPLPDAPSASMIERRDAFKSQ